jgi:hypothetical protein
LDFKKGTYRAEQQLTKEVSPVWGEVFAKFSELEKQNQELMQAIHHIKDDK